jgi:DNA-binding transcriptional LysR family regulator
MSTQGLVKSISSLESELGVSLFERDEHGNRVPTRYAAMLMEYVGHWDNDYAALTRGFEALRAQEQRQIRLGSSLGIIGMIGLEFCYEFSSLHPGVSITPSELRDDICDQALRDKSFDLSLTLAPFPPDFITLPLCSIPLSFWIPLDDPLGEKDHLELHDFEDRNVAMPGQGFKCFDTFLGMCEAEGVSLGEIVTSSEVYKFYNFSIEGKGLGFTAKHIAESPAFNQNPRMRSLPLSDYRWTVGISHLAERKLLPHELLFQDFCLSRVKQIMRLYADE